MSDPSRAIARAAFAMLAGALAGTAVLLIGAARRGPIAIDMATELPRRVMTGFYPPERAGDLSFAWTSARADVVMAGLDRSRAWTCDARLRAARAAPPLPHLQVSVDGITAVSGTAPNDFADIRFDLPPRPTRSDTRISIAVEPTLVPGPQDPRPLGVQVDRLACAPSNGRTVPPPRAAVAASAAAPALFGGAAALGGVPLAAAFSLSVLVAAVQTLAMDAGVAAFTPFVQTLPKLAFWISALTLLAAWGIAQARGSRISPFSRSCVFAAGAALFAQLAGLLHPSKLPIDVVFHAHRFDAVLAGHYFFTQPMPGGVSFPYAIGLYLFAAPWAAMTTNHAALLRITVCAADAAAYVMLYWIVVRTWTDRAAAASTLALAFTLPIVFEVIGNANLTNEFGHAASTATLALAAAWPGATRRLSYVIVLTALCTLALISHVSTIALLSATLLALAAGHWLVGTRDYRSAAKMLLAVTVVSLALAIAGYYGHFAGVYRDALRIRSAAAAAPAPAATAAGEIRGRTSASLPVRIASGVRLTGGWIGWPVLVLAAIGAWRLIRERRVDPATLVIAACAAAYVVFLGVGVMRVGAAYQRYSVEFISRVVLATSPGALLLAGAGASWGFRGGAIRRTLAAVLVFAAIVIGTRQWLGWFT